MKQVSVVVICAALLSILSPSIGMKLNGGWFQKRQDVPAVTHAPADVLTPVNEPTPLAAPPVAGTTPGGIGGGSADPAGSDGGVTQSDGTASGGDASSDPQAEFNLLAAALGAALNGPS